MTDFLSALRLYLLAQPDITGLFLQSEKLTTVNRIYVMAMPEEELKPGPHKVVVLLASGGELRRRHRTIGESRIDAVCYGETDFEAAAMERPVAEALVNLSRQTYGGVLLHNATVAGGPFQARDPEISWTSVRRQAIVRYDERGI